MSWALRLPSLAAVEGGSPRGQPALSAGRLEIACSGGVGGEPGGVQVGEGEAAAVPHEVVASAQEHEVAQKPVTDCFHLVATVNKAVTEVRRRVTVDTAGRRGTAKDPIWANPTRLLRGL